MRRYAFVSYVLLGIYLIIVGLQGLGVGLPAFFGTLAAICALIAGILFLVNR
jgi:hypothetical protein